MLASACGSSGGGLIPSASAGPLKGDFEAVAQAAKRGNGDCTETQEAIVKTEQDFLGLPATVDPGLREALGKGIANLSARARALCTQPLSGSSTATSSATTTSTSSSTHTTTPSTSTTTSSTTTSTSTTQSTPTTTLSNTVTGTTTTPPPQGGGVQAPGEAGSAQGNANPGEGGAGAGGAGENGQGAAK
jgi:hypothetical protein